MLSVVTPLYNREKLVCEMIDSLLAQTSDDWEAVIVDDGSTDRSREVVEEYARRDSRIRLFSRPEDRAKGPAAARNVGFEHARGDYIFYLDSDDLLEKDFCRNIIDQFEAQSEIDFIGVEIIPFSNSGREVLTQSFPAKIPSVDIKEHFLRRWLFVQSETFAWRRSFLAKFPRHWPEDLMVGEDRVCYYQMLTTPCRGAWASSKSQVLHRSDSQSHGKADQLTPRVNIDPRLAAQRVDVAGRLVEAFRKNGAFTDDSKWLLLENYLYCLRGVISYNHRQLAKEVRQKTIALAREFHWPRYAFRARLYAFLAPVFRFHRIPAVTRLWRTFRNLRTRKNNR